MITFSDNSELNYYKLNDYSKLNQFDHMRLLVSKVYCIKESQTSERFIYIAMFDMMSFE